MKIFNIPDVTAYHCMTRCKGNTSPSKNVRLKIIESAICLDWHLPKERSGNGKSLLKIDSSSKVGLLF